MRGTSTSRYQKPSCPGRRSPPPRLFPRVLLPALRLPELLPALRPGELRGLPLPVLRVRTLPERHSPACRKHSTKPPVKRPVRVISLPFISPVISGFKSQGWVWPICNGPPPWIGSPRLFVPAAPTKQNITHPFSGYPMAGGLPATVPQCIKRAAPAALYLKCL